MAIVILFLIINSIPICLSLILINNGTDSEYQITCIQIHLYCKDYISFYNYLYTIPLERISLK